MVLHLYREALEKVPFFKGKHPQFITSLVTYLKLEYYSPGECMAGRLTGKKHVFQLECMCGCCGVGVPSQGKWITGAAVCKRPYLL